MNNKNQTIIYRAKNGGIEFKGDLQKETIWATQSQIVELFQVHQSVVSRHINNIIKDKEVDQKSNMQKMHIANSDKPVILYSLDLILAIGYRTNSKVAIDFRQWATKTLKSYLIDGFVIDKKLVEKNYNKFIEAVEDVRKLLPDNSESVTGENILDLTKLFASTWLSLDSYDKEKLEIKKVSKEIVKLTASDLELAILNLKKELIKKGEATDLFATDRHKNSLEGIVGNIMQSFGGKHVYKSVEEKAAHLLYFMIKNHPFVDGNKRSGAFAFIWYLEKNKRLDLNKISPSALTAFTILVAESNSAHKENIVKLIMKLIEK